MTATTLIRDCDSVPAVAFTERWLPVDEWHKVAGVFAAQQKSLPAPELARIRVAEEGDRIVGFLVWQLVPHVEPLWIDESYRGRVWWPKLLEAAMAECSSAYVFAPDAHIAGMAEAMGFEELPWRVFYCEAE